MSLDFRLEVIVVPVADVDRAKAYYADQMGFNVDHDTEPNPGIRVCQLTPPGSACSIVIGTGLSDMAPGSIKGLQLVVDDMDAAYELLTGRRRRPRRDRHARRRGPAGLPARLLQRPRRQRLDDPGDPALDG